MADHLWSGAAPIQKRAASVSTQAGNEFEIKIQMGLSKWKGRGLRYPRNAGTSRYAAVARDDALRTHLAITAFVTFVRRTIILADLTPNGVMHLDVACR
jgi:hypothetical protein